MDHALQVTAISKAACFAGVMHNGLQYQQQGTAVLRLAGILVEFTRGSCLSSPRARRSSEWQTTTDTLLAT